MKMLCSVKNIPLSHELIIWGYNEQEGSITDKRADTFISYIEDARRVRQRVMEMLLLTNEKAYYSYRMDDLIVSYLIQAYLLKCSKVTPEFIDKVTHYIKDMQHTNYSGDALFRIIQAVEQGAKIGHVTLTRSGVKRLSMLVLEDQDTFVFKHKLCPKICI